MDWIVKNALNRDVERQHLNKILAEIRKTVDSISLSSSYDSVEEAVGRMVEGNREAGINVTYDPVRKVLDFAIVPFTLRLEGDVSGTATVNSLGTMVLNTTIDPAARGVEEAPQDGTPYWRQDGSWYNVPNAIFRLAEVDDPGLLTMDTYGNIYGVEIEGTIDEVDVENGDGVEGPPVISLSDLENTGEGLSPVKIYTRDSKGRIVGDEDASTDDLPEGSNLYFTDERVDDRVQSTDYSLAGAWSFEHNITVAGMTVGNGPGQHYSNIAIGSTALAGRTTATNNVAIGSRALESNQTQNNNMAIGANAGLSLTNGTNNTFLGSSTAQLAEISSSSVVVGGSAGQQATALISAVLVGSGAGQGGAGTQPVAIGAGALNQLASGQGNIGVGFQAGRLQTSGTGNIYLGFQSGVTGTAANANLAGSRNTYLGHRCGPGTPTQLSYSSAIGAEAVVTTSNTIVLGRAANEFTVIGATGDDGSGAKLQVTGAIKSTAEFRVGESKVVGARDTGWAPVTGTAQKGGGTTYTAHVISASPTQAEVQAMADALQDAHQKIKALQDALTAHGLIGS